MGEDFGVYGFDMRINCKRMVFKIIYSTFVQRSHGVMDMFPNLSKSAQMGHVFDLKVLHIWHFEGPRHIFKTTSSTAQGGGGSFKNRKPIGEIGCCESRMAEQKH